MAFDVKAKINEVCEKLKNDDKLLEKFNKQPVKLLEELIGADLPDDKIEPIIDGIKAKLSLEKLGGLAGGLFGKKK